MGTIIFYVGVSLLNVKISHPVVELMALVRPVSDVTPGSLDMSCRSPITSP